MLFETLKHRFFELIQVDLGWSKAEYEFKVTWDPLIHRIFDFTQVGVKESVAGTYGDRRAAEE